LSVWLNRPEQWLPLGTLVANVSGGWLMGLLGGWLLMVPPAAEAWRLLLGVGLLGALTTFSTFSWESLQLLMQQRVAAAFMHLMFHAGLSVGAAWLGLLSLQWLRAH
jgi:CrcB protein